MRMLSNDDLQAIGAIVDEKLDQKLDEKLEPVLEAVREGFDSVDRRFEAVDRRFEAMARETDDKLFSLKHELMDHTDRTVTKAVGDLRTELKGDIGGLRSELRERDLIG